MSRSTRAAGSRSKAEQGPTTKGTFRGAAGEVCAGCGAVAEEGAPFPVIAVLHEQDAAKLTTVVDHPTGEPGEDGQNYVGAPVCDACWRDPAHRSKNALKCHFFERKGNAAQIGLMLAGSFNIQG